MIAPQYNILKNGFYLLFYLNDGFDIGGVTSTIKIFAFSIAIFPWFICVA
jgi:hypothetical protein